MRVVTSIWCSCVVLKPPAVWACKRKCSKQAQCQMVRKYTPLPLSIILFSLSNLTSCKIFMYWSHIYFSPTFKTFVCPVHLCANIWSWSTFQTRCQPLTPIWSPQKTCCLAKLSHFDVQAACNWKTEPCLIFSFCVMLQRCDLPRGLAQPQTKPKAFEIQVIFSDCIWSIAATNVCQDGYCLSHSFDIHTAYVRTCFYSHTGQKDILSKAI